MLVKQLLLSLALLIAAAPLAAQIEVAPGEWQFLGPDGGQVTELIAAPGNPQVMYAVAQGTLYRSVDGGATWTRGTDASFHVAVDAANPSLVYAVQPLQLARSGDGGATWENLEPPAWPVNQLVAHPRFARVVFAATDEGLFQSTNAGFSWKLLRRGLPAQYRASRLVIDPIAPRRLYLVLEDLGPRAPRLFKSLDGGATWQRIDNGPLKGKPVLALVPHTRSSRILYASTPEDIYKTTDGGKRWTAIGHRGGVEGITTALAVQADRPAVLFAGSSNGVYRSLDAGETWHWVLAGVDASLFLVLPQGLFASFGMIDRPGGIFRSPDGALTWHFAGRGIQALTVTSIQFGEPGALWILADNYYVFRSTDQGNSWSPIRPDPVSTLPTVAVAVDPSDRSNVFILYSDGAAWRSGDAGQTWEAGGNVGLQALDFQIDPQTPSTLYAAGYGGIAKSTDAGDTWTPLPVANDAFYSDIDIAPSSPSTVYAAVTAGFDSFFLRSQDGGATWARLTLFNRDLKPPALAVDPLVATTVYSADYGHVLKSADAGETWSIISETIDSGSIHPVETDASGRLYAAYWDVGVFTLEDGNPDLSLLGDRFFFFPWIFTAIAPDPHDPCRVYAGALATSLLAFTYSECPSK
jgi:photosystem II stability/assembly factor-like uncharacterized protein